MKVLNQIGSLMAIFGLLATALGFFDMVPSLLQWIYKWGEGAAWGIKIGLIVVGGILFLFSRNKLANVELASSDDNAIVDENK